jgi:antitoxin component YwqK of YwqJK toxin-antitoxin module
MKNIRAIFFLLPAFFGAQNYFIYKGDTINRVDAEGKKQGYWIRFGSTRPGSCYQEFQKMEEGIYLNNRKTGLWKEYYCSGSLKNELNFADGKVNGEAVMYYENGSISECGTWKNNRWINTYYQYDSLGNIDHRFEFDEKGKRIGKDESRPWWDDSKHSKDEPKSVVPQLNGRHTLYNSRKQITRDGKFENGKLVDGKAYIYNEDGILIRVLVFKNGLYAGDTK